MENKSWIRKVISIQIFCVVVVYAVAFWGVHNAQSVDTVAELLMATTTSTDNTGLLDYLMPSFTAKTGIGIRWIATGTGKALKLGENCDVDVLMVHAPQSEKNFVDNGFGVDRTRIMYNDFVLIGPMEDPAGTKGKRVFEALQKIRSSNKIFVSRGDNSGTYKKERNLWKLADIPIPEEQAWYKQTGQGMLATINIAADLNGYTLTDRGTYIKYGSIADNEPALVILVEGDTVLLNQYSLIPVNPEHCANVKYENVKVLSDWITGSEAQRLIGEFELLGKQLFTPNATQE
jgi:tungstate transport system substrate-binding protein